MERRTSPSEVNQESCDVDQEELIIFGQFSREELNQIFGRQQQPPAVEFSQPQPRTTLSDSRIINSPERNTVLEPAQEQFHRGISPRSRPPTDLPVPLRGGFEQEPNESRRVGSGPQQFIPEISTTSNSISILSEQVPGLGQFSLRSHAPNQQVPSAFYMILPHYSQVQPQNPLPRSMVPTSWDTRQQMQETHHDIAISPITRQEYNFQEPNQSGHPFSARPWQYCSQPQPLRNVMETSYPRITGQPATIHSFDYLVGNNLNRIRGYIECNHCRQHFEVEFDLENEYWKILQYVWENLGRMLIFDQEVLKVLRSGRCSFCGSKSVKPVIDDDPSKTNWLFLFVGGYVGYCSAQQLGDFCKVRGHFPPQLRRNVKAKLLVITFLDLFLQFFVAK